MRIATQESVNQPVQISPWNDSATPISNLSQQDSRQSSVESEWLGAAENGLLSSLETDGLLKH